MELSAAETVCDAVASLGDLRRMAVEYKYAIGGDDGEGVAMDEAYNLDLLPNGILGLNADYINTYVR